MGDEKLVAENEVAKFYTNMFTEDYKDGFKIILAKNKSDGFKEYLLLRDNKPIYSSQKIEDVWFKRDLLKLTHNC